MILRLQLLLSVLSSIEKTLSPVLLIAAMTGDAVLFYFGIRKRNSRMLLSASLFLSLFLFCMVLGLYRCSSRYFLILLPGAVLLTGYLLHFMERRCRIAALIAGIGILTSQVYKDFRLDPGVRSHLNYFKRINGENLERRAALVIADTKEYFRFAHYIDLPVFSPMVWERGNREKEVLMRVWQRYLYLYDTLFLAFQPDSRRLLDVSDFPSSGICRVKLDYQEYKGRYHKKAVQFFRLDSVNHHVNFPDSATSALPLLGGPEVKPILPEQNRITPEWGLFWDAVNYWKRGETRYECKRFQKYWEIAMTGAKRCLLRSENLDLRTPFDCYIEYSGQSSKPLEIRLIAEGDGIFKDPVVAYLPLDGMENQRRIKISFYPEMNPDREKTTIVLDLPAGGQLYISRLAFDRPSDMLSEKR